MRPGQQPESPRGLRRVSGVLLPGRLETVCQTSSRAANPPNNARDTSSIESSPQSRCKPLSEMSQRAPNCSRIEAWILCLWSRKKGRGQDIRLLLPQITTDVVNRPIKGRKAVGLSREEQRAASGPHRGSEYERRGASVHILPHILFPLLLLALQ